MAYAYFQCPDCKDKGTKMLIQFGEGVELPKDGSPAQLKFHCKTCNKDVDGEMITQGEGKCYSLVEDRKDICITT